MARDGSGIFSAPAGTTATSGTTIESAKYNAFVNDLVTDANTARPIVAGGTGATTAGAALTALGGQPLDAGLTSIAGLTTAADRMIYTTASDVYAVATLTAAGRAILDDADAAAQRTTLGLGALATAASVTTAEIAAATLVTAADTIASNDNDTTIPTSAAVIDYVAAAGGIQSATSQATTSGTSKDFTGIPAGVKRVTITYQETSLSGNASHLVRIGAGSVQTTGYNSSGSAIGTGVGTTTSTAGFIIIEGTASRELRGQMILTKHSGNTWVASHGAMSGAETRVGGGVVTLSGDLDRVQITTNNGTDTFDLGSVNVHWEF